MVALTASSPSWLKTQSPAIVTGASAVVPGGDAVPGLVGLLIGQPGG